MRSLLVFWMCGCGSARPVSQPVACPARPTILHVDSIAPRSGERLEYDETVAVELADLNDQLRSESHFATVETVRSVSDDVTSTLEVRFVEGTYRALSPMAAPANAVEVTGRVFLVAREDGKETYTENGAAVSAEIAAALDTYKRRDVGQMHWLLEILTDRTFIAGRETYLPLESTRAFGDKPWAIRLTLLSIERGLARFALDLEPNADSLFGFSGEVVLDVTRARLASLDLRGTTGTGGLSEGKAGTATIRQRFFYGPPPAASSPAEDPCADAPETLHVRWVPARVGETLVHAVTTNMNMVMRGPRPGDESRLVGGNDIETENTVLAVADGLISSLETRVVRGVVRPPGALGATEPIVLTGDTIRVTYEDGMFTITRNGVATQLDEPGLADVLRGDTMRRFWVTRLVTDRSFQRGTEVVFREEAVPAITDDRAEVRLMLTRVQGTTATFQITIRAVDVGEGVTFRGRLVFDTAAARPINLSVAGSFDMDDGVESVGTFTYEQRFAYRGP